MKKPISATIDDQIIKWIDGKLKQGTRFRNKSHLIETALELLKEKEENDGTG
jgi:Arc/MetJ-type ribon-helix-helix transcriptional regulator